MRKVYILSHTDLDGYFSGGLVQFYFDRFLAKEYEVDIDNYVRIKHSGERESVEAQTFKEDIEYKHKSWTYGRQLPNLKFIKDNYDYVFVVDLCPDFYFMNDLYEHFGDKFIWIDHHVKPDNEFLEKFKESHPGEQIRGRIAEKEHFYSAAYLVYIFFEENYNTKDPLQKAPDPLHAENAPEWLKLISDFDCWNRFDEDRWQKKIMPYFSYLKSEVTNPSLAYEYVIFRYERGLFYDVFTRYSGYTNHLTDEEIDKGQMMYKMLKNIYNAEAKHGFERILSVKQGDEIKTIKAWICNTQNRSSVIFEDMEKFDEYDVFIPYHFNGEKYFYSMYTFKPDIKCNQISILSDEAPYTDILLTFNGHDDAAGSNSEKFAFPKY
jgi:oligoribonuclease NrnB/cAMP/cGMP phosphodiesterase (DHH superfamily)